MESRPSSSVAIQGERQSGNDVRSANVLACVAIANIVKTSLGPTGLDKMLVDNIGDVIITNDGATILKKLDVEHPAGKILVDLAGLQDNEVGDGTTSVVIIAAELLQRANQLIKEGIHATTIISGYRIAMKEACKHIKKSLARDLSTMGESGLLNCAKTSMSSKIIGSEAEFFSAMCLSAMRAIRQVDSHGRELYPVSAVNVLKAHGKSMKESIYVEGYALNCNVASQAMVKSLKDVKIAFLDINLQKVRMHMGVQVLVTDPNELEAIREREVGITKDRIKLIIDSGAKVILTTKGIDDLCLKYFIEAGCMAVRRCRKEDLKRLARATGGSLLLSLADLEGNESFDPAHLGTAKEVTVERICDDELILIKGTLNPASSIVLRGASDFMLDEMERSVHDTLCVLKRTLESSSVVPGGGAVEAALNIYLNNHAKTYGTREQLAIAEFADALLVIPKTLSVNSALDATELVGNLRSAHNLALSDPSRADLAMTGLDLFAGCVRDNLAAGVVEPTISKVKSIRFATEAAITILRIDDRIKLAKQEREG